eukprot:CAMPEP_0117436044 /NCGR_PEP_ID=MMETSP0759-20121206/804_1 /TAXON_ID=63605 /ORGANISM="Percolomonas cosmopolitus, Strain WS" /LENGTH=287 /DNA_ID=CAMNT_0005227631 /DNA_START=150 /DNA_END=1013 /DNA_ORIENTATION=+
MTQISLSFTVKEGARIFTEEGIGSFYAGVRPAIVASGLAWGMYFGLYNTAKSALGVGGPFQNNTKGRDENIEDKGGAGMLNSGTSGNDALRLIMSGIIAGTCTSTLTHPLWLIKTRMQLQRRAAVPVEMRYKSLRHAMRTIVSTEGPAGLFVGITPTLALVSHGVIHFVCYDILKKYYLQLFENDDALRAHESFLCGGLTKIMAVGITYPLQVVKTRLQDQQNKTHAVQYRGMVDCFKRMYSVEGFWSFYRGIWPVVARMAPQAAVTFMFYEKMMKILEPIFEESEL